MADHPNVKAPIARNDNGSRLALEADNQATPCMAEESHGESATARDLQAALRRLWIRRRSILLATVSGIALAYAGVSSIPTTYSGEARVLLGLPAPRVLNAEAVIADISPDAERVQNESLVVQSRSIAAQVIDDLHLDRVPEFNPKLAAPTFWATFSLAGLEARATAWLSEAFAVVRPDVAPSARSVDTEDRDKLIDSVLARLDVAPLGRSHVLTIKADSRDPALAAAIANGFAERYLEYRRDEKIKTMDRVDAYLMQRVSELREQVNKSEQAVEDYRRAHGLYRSGAGSLTTQQLSGLNTQLLAAQTAKADAEARLAEAQAMRDGRLASGSVPEVLQSPLIVALKGQLATAERRAAEAAATYGERHPQFRSMQAEASLLASNVAVEVAKIVDGLARDANTARARHAALAEQFEELKATMGAVNDKSIPLEALERDAAVDRKLLEAVLSRAKESTGAAEMLQAGAKLVSSAPIPEKPSSPPKILVTILGGLLGFLGAASVTLLREAGNHTFRRPEQIEAMTGLPVLTMIPSVASRSVARRVLLKPLSPYSEAVRRLSVAIALSDEKAFPSRLLFSSAVPGEGKSVMVASLARQLAASGKSVLVIDADWRRPRMHALMRCRRGPGLGELLGETGAVLNDCVHRDGFSAVDVIPSGGWDAGASYLLTSARMAELLDLLGGHYDVVLVDAPPVLAAADTLMLSRMSDKVVYVARWGHTRQEAVLAGLRQLVDAGADVAGVAMSRVEVKEYRRHSYREVNYARPAIVRFR